MTSSPLITSLSIQPAFGPATCAIFWTVDASLNAAEVYVYYSDTGLSGSWKCLNTKNPAVASTGFFTAAFDLKNGVDIGYYRIAVRETDNTMHASDPVGRLHHLTRRDYGISRKMINEEFRQMRARNGFVMWHCIPRNFGTVSSTHSEDTGAKIGVECPETVEKSYGQKYVGGFFPPVLVWVRELSAETAVTQDRSDGLGIDEDPTRRIRMMAFPKPRRGHLLVDPYTDDRFVVGDHVKPFRYRNSTSIAYEGSIHLLDRNHPAYKFSTPEVVKDPISGWPVSSLEVPHKDQYVNE